MDLEDADLAEEALLPKEASTSIGMATIARSGGPANELRFGGRFLSAWSNARGMLVPESAWGTVRLGDLVRRIPRPKFLKGDLSEPAFLVEYKDVAQDVGVVIQASEVDELFSDKVDLTGVDLIFGKLEPDSGRCFIPPKQERLIGSTELVPLSVDRTRAFGVRYATMSSEFHRITPRQHPRPV